MRVRDRSAAPQHSSALATAVGSVLLGAPVMTASGTSGHGAELAPYGPLAELGAVVVKSLAAHPWAGNPAPRVHGVRGGAMLNSVGLQGPGVAAWREHDLPGLVAEGATVVASIWGRSVSDYEVAASLLAGATGVVALEVNVSCPNVEDRSKMFAHSASATAEVLEATAAAGVPRWAKLSPNVADICEIAGAALSAGAEGLTLVNTLLGLAIDIEARRPALGWRSNAPGRSLASAGARGSDPARVSAEGPLSGGGGLSGPPLHPVAVRAVAECRRAFPDAGIVGVGGIVDGDDAVELLMAGADAVQVGTATFADPRAPWRVQREVAHWCRRHGTTVREVVGAALR